MQKWTNETSKWKAYSGIFGQLVLHLTISFALLKRFVHFFSSMRHILIYLPVHCFLFTRTQFRLVVNFSVRFFYVVIWSMAWMKTKRGRDGETNFNRNFGILFLRSPVECSAFGKSRAFQQRNTHKKTSRTETGNALQIKSEML